MEREEERIQKKQGGHHYRSSREDAPLDDTDRNTDKVIKPQQNKHPREEEKSSNE